MFLKCTLSDSAVNESKKGMVYLLRVSTKTKFFSFFTTARIKSYFPLNHPILCAAVVDYRK